MTHRNVRALLQPSTDALCIHGYIFENIQNQPNASVERVPVFTRYSLQFLTRICVDAGSCEERFKIVLFLSLVFLDTCVVE